jgi:NADH dehydrogenase
MQTLAGPVLITGANGNLGRQLIARFGEAEDAPAVRALVRSGRAADQVRGVATPRAPELVIADYTDEAAMADAVAGCGAVVHLVGIIKETRGARYEAAHERTCEVLARTAAAAGVRRIVYLSIVGSRADSPNPCLASKGRAEDILLGGRVPATVIRVPMVLGPGDPASRALRAQARSRLLWLVRGGATLQQPIDARDVGAAVVGALGLQDDTAEALDLGGPERLTHRALVMRAATLYDRRPFVIPVPLALARGAVATLERLLPAPPVTRAMLEILQHDDRIDEAKSCERLGIRLTPLDETLGRYVGPESLSDE